MDGYTILGIITGTLLFLLALAEVWFLTRSKRCRRKVRQMSRQEKIETLQEIIEPFGFTYVPGGDLFSTRLDAWQRKLGYEALFDRGAEHFNMIIDTWPIYFDYDGKTWLVEFWKGQYGINMGTEVGIYHARHLIPKGQEKLAHYDAVSDEEMLPIHSCLTHKQMEMGCISAKHWWLTTFRMGRFARSKDLCLRAAITFQNQEQANAFFHGLRESGHPEEKCQICYNEVVVNMDFSKKYHWLRRAYRAVVQGVNWMLCRLYLFVTRPFITTLDRLLYLYNLLPWCFRKMLRVKKRIFRKKYGFRRKQNA